MRNDTTLNALSTQLQQNCGDILAACRQVGVSLIFVNQWRKDDKAVDEILVEAERVGTQGLVSAAIQRGVHGVQKGVYYKGVQVDTEIVYSDGLLQTLLKAKVSEFARDGEGAPPQVTVNIANLMPRAENYQDWLAMKQQTLAAPVDAEYVDVTSEREKPLEALGRVMSPFAGIDL